MLAALQSELIGLKAEMGTKVATLEETIANLAHENAILKRRLFGNKTERSHTSEAVQRLFGKFSGFLQADASNVYDILDRGPPVDGDEGVSLVGCWARLRRYMFEAAICRYPVGLQGLMRIRAIYAADESVGRAPATERGGLRERHVRPLMTSFFDWVRSVRDKTPGRNLATKAIGYAVNQEAELLRVLDDINLPLDNTHSYAADGITDAMPRPGLCRVEATLASNLVGSLILGEIGVGIVTDPGGR